MYKLIIWKAIWTDSGPETGTDSYILKPVVVKNTKATKAWYDWQERTGRQCLPGDFIAGHVAIIKKVKNDRSRSNEAA